MSRRLHSRNTPFENIRDILRSISWKLFLLLLCIILLSIPLFIYGTRLGYRVLPSMTRVFYDMTGSGPAITPTPQPVFSSVLPQIGAVPYTVQEGDSCVSILAFQMRMANAGQIFSDVKPETVNALDASIGHDCHALQPGLELSLPPHYPLVALGGVILEIEAATTQQALPTPLIHVTSQASDGADCSNGCLFTVRIAPQVEVKLKAQTMIPVRKGAWIWAQAMLARKQVRGFDSYPFADPKASLNGMMLNACDVQIDDKHDDGSLACDQITPNTIDDDGGAWLFGVMAPSSLDHWHYRLNVPQGARVLIWLSQVHGTLTFQPGNPAFKYNGVTQRYTKV